MSEAPHTGTLSRTAVTDRAAAAVRGHVAWRTVREHELREPFGPLSPVGLHWPTSEPRRLPGVPGEWWVADGVLRTRPAPGGTAVLAGERIEPDGSAATGLGEGRGRTIGTFLPQDRAAADDALVAVEVVLRTGRYAVRPQPPGVRRVGGGEVAALRRAHPRPFSPANRRCGTSMMRHAGTIRPGFRDSSRHPRA